MKKNKFFLIAVCCLLSAVFLLGCGGGAGSPGSKGTEDTGVEVDATITPLYLNENTYSCDAFRADCDPEPDTVDPEPFTDHTARLSLRAWQINPNNTTFPAGNLYVEKYTVEFRRSSDSIGAPPIVSDTRYKTIVIPFPPGSLIREVEDTVILVDLNRKEQYSSDVTSGRYSSGMAYINTYTAVYTFEGKNEYGKGFTFKAQTDFQIGSFDYCQ